jgi:hypothetical protein
MKGSVLTKTESKPAPERGHAGQPSVDASSAMGTPLFLRAPVQMKCACGTGAPCTACANEQDDEPAVQRKEGANSPTNHDVHAVARRGVSGALQTLPHLDRIQSSFGAHDVTGARASIGGAAAEANDTMGSHGYTVGDRIAFRSTPDLRLAAHEAAHVVQQRGGVQLDDGVGHPGDRYEQQADAAADAVERGESAESILSTTTTSSATSSGPTAVQHQLAITATRIVEPPVVPSGARGGGGADGPPSAARPPARPQPSSTESGAQADGEGGPGQGASTGGSGAARPGGADSGSGGSGGPAAEAAAPPASAAGGNAATTTSGGGQCSGGVAQCYDEPSEEPAEEPEETPPNPPPTQVDAQASDAGEEDAPEPDDCPPPRAAADAAAGATARGGAIAPATAGAAQSARRRAPGPGAPRPRGPAPGASQSAAESGGATAPPAIDTISLAEGQRAEAVAAYERSSAALAAAANTTAALRNGGRFASGGDPEAEAAASARAGAFFTSVADRIDAAIAIAADAVPAQLGAQAEAAKASLAASLESQKAAISAGIEVARGQARVDAAVARRQVRAQAGAFVADVQSGTASAIDAVAAAHADSIARVDELETSTLDTLNALYADGRADLEGLGTTIGDEATATGEEFARTYRGFRHCTENGFWDGDLSERRSQAQENAAREVGKSYHDRIVAAARKRAREVTRDGRKKDRCEVILAASGARASLDQQRDALTAALEAARDSTVEQAGATRDTILGSIDAALAATLRQLDRQEHDARQAADDAGYTQQVLQEQLAHAGAASLQQSVAAAVGVVQATLADLQATLASSAPPDTALLDTALSVVTQNLAAAVDALDASVQGGAMLTAQLLGDAALQGLASLDAVALSNDAATKAIGGAFASSMGDIGGTDNFAAERDGFSQALEQSSAAGEAALGQIVDAMSRGCDGTLSQAETTLAGAYTQLEQNLRQSKQGIECEITTKADEAASHEAPAWKMLVAILLVIIVIVIVIAVTIATAGGALAGLGVLGTIAAGAAIGAAVGAVTSGLLAIAGNLWSNRSWSHGVLHAMAVGAITGAIGGAVGAGAGLGVGALVKGASSAVQVAAQFGTAMVTAGGLDVVTQYVMGGLSFEHFSWANLGMTLVITALTFGLGHAAGARAAARAPAGAAEPPVPAPGEASIPGAHPTEPVPGAHPTEPVPAAAPEAAVPATPEATAPVAEPVPTPEPPPAATPEPPPGAEPSLEPTPSAASAEPEPVAPREPAGPGEPTRAEPGEAPVTPEENATLENTALKDGDELSPSEATTEREVANRTKGEPIDEPPFTIEHELPNGHKIKETPEGPAGDLFERCSGCAIYDRDGNLVEEIPQDVSNPAAQDSKGVAHDVGVQQGREAAADLGLEPSDQWVNPLEDRGPYGQGFDDVLVDAAGNDVIAEYKGGQAELAPGQMERPWVQGVINRMRAAGDTYWANRLQTALDNGTLRGVTFSTPIDPVTGVPGPTTVRYHTY